MRICTVHKCPTSYLVRIGTMYEYVFWVRNLPNNLVPKSLGEINGLGSWEYVIRKFYTYFYRYS